MSVAPNDGYGFGPRHLDFHPTRPWVHVLLERQNQLDMFEFSGDALSPAPVFRKDTLAEPANIRGRQIAGTVHVHPNGRLSTPSIVPRRPQNSKASLSFVGGKNNFAVYSIDAATGEPSLIEPVDTRGIHCRTFQIDPSGRLLVAAHIMPLLVKVKEGAALRTVPASLAVSGSKTTAGSISCANTMSMSATGRCFGRAWCACRASSQGRTAR